MILCIVLGTAWYSFIKISCLNSLAICGPLCILMRWWSDVYLQRFICFLIFIVCSANSEGEVCLHGFAASIFSDSIDVGSVG